MEIRSNRGHAGGEPDFFDYSDSIGFFEHVTTILPPKFYILFDIARTILSDMESEAMQAVEDIAHEEKIYEPDRDENIQVNRVDKISPLSDKMEIDHFRTINDLKKALPRELAQEDQLLDAKLFTKTLVVQRFYESESDSFKPISTTQDEHGRNANRFEQKFFILLDRSRSMDLKFRSFYSKCLVAEFLRRKHGSRAKLYYRAFDTTVGPLHKIEKAEDFPRIVEEVLLTTTGGRSTNLQDAIFQAIKDIEYDKEMLNSEILVVTDGVSKIDKHEMKRRLGSIKLHVLKLGDDMAEADFYELKSNLDAENISFDPTSVNLKQVRKQLQEAPDDKGKSELPLATQRAYRMILDHSERLFKDLEDIATKYITIDDLKQEGDFAPSEEQVEGILKAVETFKAIDFQGKSIDEMTRLYKQIYLFGQYIEQLLQVEGAHRKSLEKSLASLHEIKQAMLKDPELLFTMSQVKELSDDKNLMKLAKKDARRMMKEMQLNDSKLSMKDMKRGQLLFTMDVGEGSMGQFLLLLIIKFFQLLKAILTFPFRIFSRKKDS